MRYQRAVLMLVLVLMAAGGATGCTPSEQGIGVRATETGRIEVFYLSCDDVAPRFVLSESDRPVPASAVTSISTGTATTVPLVMTEIWQGEGTVGEEPFLVPIDLRADHQYTLREVAHPAEHASVVFRPEEVPTEGVTTKTSSGYATESVAAWNERSARTCDYVTGRYLRGPALIGGLGCIGFLAFVTFLGFSVGRASARLWPKRTPPPPWAPPGSPPPGANGGAS